MRNILNRKISADFAVIDSIFPQKTPFAFRNAEINEYINHVQGFKSFTMYPMRPGDAPFPHSYGMDHQTYLENSQGYGEYYPDNLTALNYLDEKKTYKINLAYSFFLGETFSLLPFYEKNKIPFVFVLYPGGLFSLSSSESEIMLRKIFNSDYFRGVIVTQKITERYLLKNKLCPSERIDYIYGGFVQFKPDEVLEKELYRVDKQTFDICFVAAKYSDYGVDKGYDLFIETAKKMCKETEDIMFHVVGGFDKDEIDTTSISDRITFHGYMQPDELLVFYKSMDIFLAPNRPFKLYEGNFDGFPLGIDAAYCGVALFVADELSMNINYTHNKDIVIIPLNSDKIMKMILKYYNNVDMLYELSSRCQETTQDLFDINQQINSRISVFKKYSTIKTM